MNVNLPPIAIAIVGGTLTLARTTKKRSNKLILKIMERIIKAI